MPQTDGKDLNDLTPDDFKSLGFVKARTYDKALVKARKLINKKARKLINKEYKTGGGEISIICVGDLERGRE